MTNVYLGTAGGSSPLTRGKPSCAHHARDTQRLIPAHAGKTLVPAGRMVIGGAHPRSRGENDDGLTIRCPRGGSSPLTRGKPNAGVALGAAVRLIPAHAGKTRLARMA